MKLVPIPTPPSSTHPHTPLWDAKATIIYTETDEAPALATYNLLPIFSKFASLAGVDIVPCDISLLGRVLAAFPEYLQKDQLVPNNLAYLGDLCQTPDPIIIKLPNISASVPQLEACIQELRSKGYNVPLYPNEPKDDVEREVKKRYAKVLGSAVNPVLRQGNSDRHASTAVKRDAQKNPIKDMTHWTPASKCHVANMKQGDFYGTEQSAVISNKTSVVIQMIDENGKVTVLKEDLHLSPGELIDGSYMDVEELCNFFEREMQDAKDMGILLSLHLKSTMMKISDPIMFGHALKTYFRSAWEQHGVTLEQLGANPNNGLSSIFALLDNKLPSSKALEIRRDFEKCYEERPLLAMTNSDKGITNLHCPSDLIIDNSMPIVIRDGGKMYNKLGELQESKCIIPDRSYGPIYQEMMSYLKTNGHFDCATMGHVSNVGLMAMKAEEYGSHDTTFEVPGNGVIRVCDKNSKLCYIQHKVKKGDIWRMCQTKDVAIQDWVKLAVTRARETQAKAIFWLDTNRAHDRQIIDKVHVYLKDHDISSLDVQILDPKKAMRETLERTSAGLDTISVTGNVLRDYLTDLFPILEMGTSAKLLSIVSLLAGGTMYETGAGGSAPIHVEQFIQCGHLRWNSLGEYQAIAEALSRLGLRLQNERVTMLGESLHKAIGAVMKKHEMPERRVHEIDNRGANFFIALHWAEFLSKKDEMYAEIYMKLLKGKDKILEEIESSQGEAVDLGGYYRYDYDKTKRAMNPSVTLSELMA